MLTTDFIHFSIPAFSQRDKEYQAEKPEIKPFIQDFPSIESLLSAAKRRSSYKTDRKLLVDVLTEQYQSVELSSQTQENIEALLDEKTFTLTTAHQPVVLTGPLYYIFKIAGTINLSRKLNALQSDYRFVPVFLSGGEDHDFEEIATLHLFGKSVTWSTDKAGGSVGKMPVDGLQEVIEEVSNLLGERSLALEFITKVNSWLPNVKNYAELQFRIINELFSKHGLICFNPDHPQIKKRLSPIFHKELLEQVSAPLVRQQQETINNKLGYEGQAYVRDINIFYRGNGFRNRIEEMSPGTYQVIDQEISFGKDEIEDHILHFSPNVVLRPLCQEYILPNVAYLGGGGELAYWLERKTQFEAFDIPYPILIRRNSAALISSREKSQWESLGFDIQGLFNEEHQLTNQYLASNNLEFSLEEEIKSLEQVFKDIGRKAQEVNPSLDKSVAAMLAKEKKQVEQFESRLRRELKQKEESNLSKILKLKHKVQAGKKLQERQENILTFASSYGLKLIDELIEIMDPLNKDFMLISMSKD